MENWAEQLPSSYELLLLFFVYEFSNFYLELTINYYLKLHYYILGEGHVYTVFFLINAPVRSQEHNWLHDEKGHISDMPILLKKKRPFHAISNYRLVRLLGRIR